MVPGMNTSERITLPAARPNARWLPWLLFLVGISLTYVVGASFQSKARSVEELNYRAAAEALKTLIVSDFGRHAEVVWGARALIAAQGDILPSQAQNYLQTVRLQEAYPGIGALYVVTPQAGALQGEPEFEVVYAYTPYQQPDLSGYNLSDDAVTLAALEQAMRRNAVVFSGRSSGPFQAAFPGSHLMVLPVYGGPFVPDNLVERRAALNGWIVAVFTPREWLASALRLLQTPLDFTLLDVDSSLLPGEATPTPLFSKGEPLLLSRNDLPAQTASGQTTQPFAVDHIQADLLRLGGRDFLLATAAPQALRAQQSHVWELGLIYGLGLLTSLVVALAMGVVLNRRWHVERRADELAADLERMSYVARFTKNPVVITDPDNRIVWANEAFETLNGYSQADTLGKQVAELIASPLADPQALAVLRRAREAREGAEVETVNRTRHGRDYWAKIELRPLYNQRGDFVGHMSIHTDVDQERRNAAALQAALRATKALMSTLQRYMIITETSPDGDILEANERYLEISGFSLDDLRLRGHRAVSSGLHPPEFWQGMWEAISGGQPWRGEICNRNQRGQLYWVDTLIAPFTDEHGDIEKFVSVAIDITERKRIEQDLLTSERLLRRTSRVAGIGAWTVDLNTSEVQWSDHALQLLRADPSLPAPTLEAVRARSSSEAQLTLQYAWTEALEHDQAFDLELELTNFAGEERWFRVAGEVEQRGLGGRKLVGALQDITEQVQAQQRIERSERILRTAIEALDEGFVLYDPEDRLAYCNERYREVYPQIADLIVPGVTFEELVRGGIARGVFPHAYGREAEFLAERLALHRSEQTDAEQQQADGRWIRITERKTPEGYTVGFRVDITAFKQAVADAQAASRSKSQFVANMSHEIRTPMNAILGMLELLQRSPLNPHQLDYVGKTRGAAQSLLGILNDILDFSKVEAGKMELLAEPCHLDTLLQELSLILSSNLGSKPLELLFELDPQLPPVLLTDELRLKQILINLGGNAVKFTPEGEVVLRIKVSRREAQKVWLMFTVADTGIGISQAQQQVIFEGFSQAEASTTRRFGGTGLGLAITQRLVQLMGGTLQLDSEPGRGSVFHFELPFDLPVDAPLDAPMDVPAAEAALPVSGELPARAGERLLVMDAHARSREVLRRMAEQAGWQVQAAEHWEQVLPWQGPLPDAVLLAPLGQRLSVVDAEAWAQLLDVGGVRPALLLLSRVPQADLLQTMEPQPDATLVKPLTPGMLRVGLAEACAHRQVPADTADISLPAVSSGSATGRPSRLAGLRLLVVEDNPVNQQVARELLVQEGAEVQVADNGLLGVQRVSEAPEPFDVVLMDMQMPVMDGLEAARRLRAAGYLSLPIVAMTANAMDSDRELCLAAGMDEHVGKPFDLEQLVHLLLRFSRGRVPAAGGSTAEAVNRGPTGLAPAVLDVAAAVRRMGGDEPFLRRTLARVLPELDGLVARLLDADSDGSGAAASQRQLAHSIKGLAATVGADALAACAAAVEHAARQGHTPATDNVASAYRALRRQANTYLRSEQGAPAVGAEPAPGVLAIEKLRQCAETLAGMTPLLQNFDMQALQLYDNSGLPLWWASYGERERGMTDGRQADTSPSLAVAAGWVRPLVQAMDALDFLAAQQALKDLLHHLEMEALASDAS